MTTDTGAGAGVGLGPDGGSGTTDDAGAKERAQQTASTAADEGKHVAGVAADEARSVVTEATAQARDLVGEARGHVRSQLDEQGHAVKDQLAGTLGTLSDDLGSMAQDGSGLAANLAHEAADRAGRLSRHLEGREPHELLDDVRRFARQRPGAFLVGALAAGVVVGRLARGAKDAIDAADGESGSPVDTPRVTSGAPDTTSVHASHGQPTQPPSGISDVPPTGGYSSGPAGEELDVVTPVAPPVSGGFTS